MKITHLALSKITVRTKNRLAPSFDCSVPTVERWIKDNDDNGDLTKAMAVQIISEETELAHTLILEETEVKDTAVAI